MKRYNIVLFTLIVCACSVQAQTVEPITYKQYMHKVSADNLEYAAEKMNCLLYTSPSPRDTR